MKQKTANRNLVHGETQETNNGPSESCGCHTCGKIEECCEMESGAVEDGWCEDWVGLEEWDG